MNYKKIYESIVDRAKNRKLNSYKEKNHIIPKCIGGSDDETNLVELTAKEHFICHLLLCEIYPNENTLKSARWAMTCFKSKNHNRKYIISSSQYDRIKNEMAILKRGVRRSDEIKEKISNSHKGKNMSEETKKKISDKMKGRVQSEEHKLNQSLSKKGQVPWNRGKHMSEETKKKISDKMKGRDQSEEDKLKLSLSKKGQVPWNKGKPMSEEIKRKISLTKKGIST